MLQECLERVRFILLVRISCSSFENVFLIRFSWKFLGSLFAAITCLGFVCLALSAAAVGLPHWAIFEDAQVGDHNNKWFFIWIRRA